MEVQQKLEIADRITELRKRSPFTQPQVAEKLGIGLRAYQKLEAVGTESFERCEEIAKIHSEWSQRDPEWSHVSAPWVWDGVERDGDLLAALDEATPSSEVRELSEAVGSLRKEVAELSALLLSEVESRRKEKASSRSKREQPSRSKKAPRK